MSYTIKISENSKDGEKLLKQIKELVGDSPFVSIYKEENELTDAMVQELENRYQQAIKNPEEGKTWEEVKKNLLNQ